MKKIVLAVLGLFVLVSAAHAQSANELLEQAQEQAKAENKNILLIFHASWCTWCKKFEKGLDDPRVKPYFDSNFVRVHFTVKESATNKHLETEGGEYYIGKFGGSQLGIPFWTILNNQGDMIANSVVKGENLGCPASKKEVGDFIKLLKTVTVHGEVDEQKIKEVFILSK